MKTISMASGSFLTGTEIADAITGYGLALARAGAVDVVDIPFVGEHGAIDRVQLRIGWLIDTAVISTPPSGDELIEADTIHALLVKTRSLTRSPRQVGHSDRTDPLRNVDWDEII